MTTVRVFLTSNSIVLRVKLSSFLLENSCVKVVISKVLILDDILLEMK